MLTVGSLFAGIGGFDLGFERAGMRVVWQCEQNDYCRRVLARHWPGVPCHPDVRALVADTSGTRRRQDVRGPHGDEGTDARWDSQDTHQPDGRHESDGAGPVLPVPVPYVDVLCGGFPCQDLSYAGKGAGIDGERSGLWREFARLIGELRPRYVVVENVPALLGRGLGRVLGDLAACGYDAEWDCLPASAFGAPHRRDRVWIVGYPASGGRMDSSAHDREHAAARRRNAAITSGLIGEADCGSAVLADPVESRLEGHGRGPLRQGSVAGGGEGAGVVADAESIRRERSRPARAGWLGSADGSSRGFQDADERALQPWRVGGRIAQAGGSEWWAAEPPVGRVAHGIPDRLGQLSALGNALVPQIAEWIGWRILEWEEAVAA